MRLKNKLLYAIAAVCIWLTALPALAGVMIFPNRIEFSDKARSASVSLVNSSEKTITYRMFWREVRMQEDGSFLDVTEEEPGDNWLSPYVRFSPRQIILKPGDRQKIRLALRVPNDLPDGEYRSHLILQEADVEEPNDVEPPREDLVKEGLIGAVAKAQLGMSMPVIFRKGDLTSNIAISDVKLRFNEDKSRVYVSTALGKQGEKSVYGSLYYYWVPQEGAEPVEIARVLGIAIYSQNDKRQVTFDTEFKGEIDLTRGFIKTVYKKRNSDEIFTETLQPIGSVLVSG